MDLKLVEKAVSRIQSSLFKKSNSHSIGLLKSNFKGSGLQFKEHQVYCYGDDVRFIDWRMLAKTNHPYIKTFEEERNVEITVVIDVSESMITGYKGVSKLQAAIEICCLLYLIAKESDDQVTCLIFTDEIIRVPKMNGRNGISHLLMLLEKNKILDKFGKINLKYFENKEQNLKSDLYVRNIYKHLLSKKEVILLSDFQDFIDLNVHRKLFFMNHIHSFQILSPLDEAGSLPYDFKIKLKSGGSTTGSVKMKKENDIDLSKKIFTKLQLEKSYLDEFIKAMIRK